MPVIGRLDKQVEDVLISPLSKKRPADPEPPHAEDDSSQPPAADEPSAGEPRRTPEETLPVWLL